MSLTGCAEAEPRSIQYFEAHLDEARKIVANCQSGTPRSGECANAGVAVETADAKEKFKRFRGK
ncbi:EexN family lipoprotein [Sphingopyxis sp.]|uniref:EexN family lipoprotein n=1 Tax=Sphingopyxis sp. TaxID=1908224 RepID=UPI003BA94281